MRKFDLKILLVLSLGHLSTDIYQGALPAILPFLKEKLSLSYSMAGIIMLASSMTSSVIQPLFGLLSDKKEKPILLPAGCLLAGLGFSLLAVPSHFAPVLALVIISGLGVASYHPEGFKTAYYYTGTRPATGMSVFSVGGNLGFALGPIVSLSVITHLGLSFLPATGIVTLIFLFVLSFFWKSLIKPKIASERKKTAIRTAVKGVSTPLLIIIGTVILRSWTHVGLMTFIPFYYIDYLNGDPLYAGTLVSVFLLGGALGTLGGSPLADRFGHKKYLIVSLALTTLLFPLIFFLKGTMLFIALGIIGMVLISTFTVTIVMAQHLLPGNLGVASGLMVGFAIGTGGVGVTLLGVLADRFGVPVALKSIAVLPFLALVISLGLLCPDRK